MPANTVPIFSKQPDVQWGTVATANTAKDGTGTVVTVFTADVTNGSFIQKLKVRPLGTNVATVLRLFLNNGATNATATNNIMIDEFTLTATTLSEVAALAGWEIPVNVAIPAGYKLNVTIGTTIAAGVAVSTFGGDY